MAKLMKTKKEIVENWLPRYTGQSLNQFGEYILLTNFDNYVKAFAEWHGVAVNGLDKPMRSATAEGITIINFGTYAAEPCYIVQCNDVAFDIDRYLAARNDATIKTIADWVSHARFRDDASRAGAVNWVALKDHLAPGKADRWTAWAASVISIDS